MDNFIEFLYSKFLQSDGVSIDTRTLERDNLFFALSGPNFNANEYAAEALEKGASFAVVDHSEYVKDSRIILAQNSLKALQDLAIFHRSRFKRPILAITGSNGKTTTKELIHAVLSKQYVVHATPGNYNNHIGVPLTLLHIHPQVEIAVIEMGANHVGEIAQLSEMANPTHGLITNIGEAHTEYFGGIEGVLRGKSELFDHMRKTGGTALINLDDERLAPMTRRFENPVAFPSSDVKLLAADPFVRCKIGRLTCQTQLIGRYNFGNIAAAVAAGRSFSVPDEVIVESIASYLPENQRSQIIQKGSNQIILDAYNANPTSMRAALESLAALPGKKMAILGDMSEVENPEDKHAEIGVLLGNLGIEEVLLCGPLMKHAQEHGTWFSERADLFEYLSRNTSRDRHILIKASRSMKLEETLEYL